MENLMLRVSFFEREFFAESRDGKSIRGHEPAIIKTENGTQVGRVLNVERLAQAQSADTLLFQTSLPLCSARYNIHELIGNNRDGKIWISKFEVFCDQYLKERIPQTIEVTNLEMPWLKYQWLDDDYFKTNLVGNGVINVRPEQMVYNKIMPPVKYTNGEWIRNLNYNRNIVFSDKRTGGFSTEDPCDPRHFHSNGTLIGMLNEKDLKDKAGFFGKFPAKHFLDVVYPVCLRDIGELNPLTIRFEAQEK